MLLNNLILSMVCILALLVLAYMIKTSDILEKRMRHYFRLTIFLTIVIILAEAGTVIAETLPPQYRTFHIICNIVGFAASPVIPLLLAYTFCNRYTSFWSWPMLPAFFNFLVTLTSPLWGGIFTVSQQNVYARGKWYFVYIISYIVGLAFLFFETFVSMHRYQNKNRYTIMVLMVFLLAGTSLQVVVPQVHTTWFTVTLALPIYYGYFCELSEKYDVLTELFNRRAYQCELQELESRTDASIILLDIDDFKKINDTHGHQYGDACLNAVGKELKETFQKLGKCYRIGGDEFCILSGTRLEEKDLSEAIGHLEQRTHAAPASGSVLPGVTVGYTFYQKGKGTVSEAVQAADQCLYENKRAKKKA